MQVVIRLEHDLGVNLPGAAMILELLEELQELRSVTAGREAGRQ
jgi:hypothetical protein